MLEGIRIVEVEGLGPAPFAGMLLADLGADVIVVHRRQAPVPGAPASNLIDRGKRSIVLDLKDPGDRDILIKLASGADGLIEGFRPGVMERLGLGPDTLRAGNPRLVYGRITGWGQDGPLAARAGHDLNYIAASGALYYAASAGDAPLTPPTLTGDIGGGALYLVIGMLAGLLHARASGEGTVVDAAIVDGSAHMMNLMMSARVAGMLDDERGRSILDGSPWNRCYRTSDDGWLAVQCLEPGFYDVFLDRLGVSGDERFERSPDPATWPTLAARIAGIIAGQTVGHWTQVFEDSDACAAPVLDPLRAARHPHLASRGIWIDAGGELQARAAPRFDGRTPDAPKPAPVRGEHTEEILAGLAAD